MKTLNSIFNLMRTALVVMLLTFLGIQNFANDSKNPNTEALHDCCVVEIFAESETEEEIKLESWMLNPEDWYVEENQVFAEEKEVEILVEAWMLDAGESWNLNENVTEPEIEIENWMTDLNQW